MPTPGTVEHEIGRDVLTRSGEGGEGDDWLDLEKPAVSDASR